MKFRVEREGLADAVTWAARSLSTRPTMPVLAGLLLSVSGDVLVISGFDLEASTEVELEVTSSTDGQALVSGRLLADITKALPPHPVDVTVDGSRLTIACGAARFTLPTMPVEDYPTLPSMPRSAPRVRIPPGPPPGSRCPPPATTPCRCSPAFDSRSTARSSPSPPPTGI